MPLWFEPAAPGQPYLFQAGRGPLWAGMGAITFGEPAVTLRLPSPVMPVPEQPMASHTSRFVGSSEQWRTAIPNYGALRFPEAAPGIDVLLYATRDGKPEFDVIAQPGADLASFRITIEGHDGAAIADAALHIRAGASTHQLAPTYAYQDTPAGREPVASTFLLEADGRSFGFAYEWRHPGLPLVIDPRVDYATYLGGPSPAFDYMYGVEADPTDPHIVYVTGYTSSTNFPSAGSGFNPTPTNTYDVFVAKLDTSKEGSASLVWTNFLGGTGSDYGYDIDVGPDGVYVSGYTGSAGHTVPFPTTANAYRNTPYCAATAATCYYDAFLAKISLDGSSLLYATLWGGTSSDYGYTVSTDGKGIAVLGGYTSGATMPTKNAHQQTGPSTSGFGAQFDTTKVGEESLVFATYVVLSSTYYTYVYASDIDEDGTTWLGGYTYLGNVAGSANAVQPTASGGYDGFLVAVQAGGSPGGPSAFPYMTYLGGSSYDQVRSIDTKDGLVYATGYTGSSTFPTTPNTYKPSKTTSDYDAFAVVIDKASGSLVAGTFVGGPSPSASGYEYGNAIRVDSQGDVHVMGYLDSISSLPTVGQPPIQTGSNDLFAFQLSPDLRNVVWSVRLGGPGWESMSSFEAATINAYDEPVLAAYYVYSAVPWMTDTSFKAYSRTYGYYDPWLVRLAKAAPSVGCAAPVTMFRGVTDLVHAVPYPGDEPIDPNGYAWWLDSDARNHATNPPDIAYDLDGDGQKDPGYGTSVPLHYGLDEPLGPRTITVRAKDVTGRPPDTGYGACTVTVVNRPPVATLHMEGSSAIRGRAVFTAFGPSPSHDPDGTEGDVLDVHWVLPPNGACEVVAQRPHEVQCTWSETGLHEVGLAVVDPDGAAAFASAAVDVQLPRPVADFAVAGHARLGCGTPHPAVLRDLSKPDVAPITSWAWDFGADGTVDATTPDAQWTPPGPGTFPVRLTVTDGQGFTDSKTAHVTAEQHVPPAAALHRSPAGIVYTGVDLLAWDRSVPGGVGVQTLAWDFGDGAVAAGASASHQYAKPGRYLLQLTVTDASGCASVATDVVHVEALEPNGYVAAPEAGLEARVDGPRRALVGELVRFSDATPATHGALVDWRWDIPGAQVPAEPWAQARFATAGTHTVALTVTDSAGRTATALHELLVEAPSGAAAEAAAPPVARAGPDRSVAAGS
ncbi:MAG TPA: PKD domain-containing protein, partial [Candidatus Thermoplasmatota archaeon]|nr:PKD domain-containing protein [Candidatus Thermoplasmatota archaeon]